MKTPSVRSARSDRKLPSRQYRWAQKAQANGRCRICGRKRVTAHYCLDHAIANRERVRKYVGCKRRSNSLTYRLAA